MDKIFWDTGQFRHIFHDIVNRQNAQWDYESKVFGRLQTVFTHKKTFDRDFNAANMLFLTRCFIKGWPRPERFCCPVKAVLAPKRSRAKARQVADSCFPRAQANPRASRCKVAKPDESVTRGALQLWQGEKEMQINPLKFISEGSVDCHNPTTP